MSIRPRDRFLTFKRDSFTCQYCGRKPPEVRLQCDHVIARAKGGKDHVDNYITSCYECNIGKGTEDLVSVSTDKNPTPQKINEIAALLGRLGGSSRSEEKAKASRENGKRGGRPKTIRNLNRSETYALAEETGNTFMKVCADLGINTTLVE